MRQIIAPSLLSADMARLGEEAQAVIKAGADCLHFDVMDNHYVPNLTFGPVVCQALCNHGIDVPIDVHLMTSPVDDLITAFADAGANSISFHPEASQHVDRSLSLIKDKGLKAGIVLNPATPINIIEHILYLVDFVLVMSVNPGFGGQKFITGSTQKIQQLREFLNVKKPEVEIAVDGGINQETIGQVVGAGANIIIAGSYIFHSKDYKTTIDSIRDSFKQTQT